MITPDRDKVSEFIGSRFGVFRPIIQKYFNIDLETSSRETVTALAELNIAISENTILLVVAERQDRNSGLSTSHRQAMEPMSKDLGSGSQSEGPGRTPEKCHCVRYMG